MAADAHSGLERKLGLFPATNIVIANMVGAGIFTTSGLLMAELGSPLMMLLLWVIGGLIALSGALCYGALGVLMPRAGGEYVFLSELYHPAVGFLSGWTSFVVGFSAPIAASAMGCSHYLGRAFPGFFAWAEGAGLSGPEAAGKVLSVGIILLFTVIHLRGIEFGARVQNVLTVGKVLLILALIAGGFFWGKGDPRHFGGGGGFLLDFGGWKTIGLSLMWIMFSYSGWNASTYIGSEIRSPGRNLPRSLLYGTGVVLLLYLGLNALFIYGISPERMSGVISVGGLAMGELFGRPVEIVASALISFALFSSLSAFIILGPRVYYAMADEGYFFRSVARIHPRFGVPGRAILLQSAIAILMVLSGTFDQVLTYMGFSLGIFPILTVLGLFRLKRMNRHRPYLTGLQFAPILYAGAAVFILVLAFLQRPVESSSAILTVLAGLPLFLFFKNRYPHRSTDR